MDGSQSLLWNLAWWQDRYPNKSTAPYNNAQLIRTVTPAAKILAILRDPADRLYSDYLYFHNNNEGVSPEKFHVEVEQEIERFERCLARDSLRDCCYSSDNSVTIRLHIGIYFCYIRDWVEVFEDNIYIVTLEEYMVDQAQVLRNIFTFLEVVQPEDGSLNEFLSTSKVSNSRKKSDVQIGPMLNKTLELLKKFYDPYNAMLASLVEDEKYLFR